MGQGGRLVYIYMYNLVDERCSQFTDTSEHIRFYFLVFLFFPLFSFWLRADLLIKPTHL